MIPTGQRVRVVSLRDNTGSNRSYVKYIGREGEVKNHINGSEYPYEVLLDGDNLSDRQYFEYEDLEVIV